MISLISSPAAPSFDHPLQMLRACHGKILRQCDTLRKMEPYLKERGCDVQIRQAAAGILRYFDTAGQLHHRDEEEDLFPALRSCSGVDAELLDRLLGEHIVMLRAWDALRPLLEKLAQGAQVALDDTLTEKFISSYTSHIATENTELLPMASRLLSPRQIKSIGQNMSGRRGAKFQENL